MIKFEFHNPWVLLLLLLIPLLAFFHYRAGKRKQKAGVKISSLKPFQYSNSLLTLLKPFLYLLRMAALTLIIIALARPQNIESGSTINTGKGIDIILTVDTSLSMLARDLKPDRLDALKGVAEKFVMERPSDRIGLVDYSGEAVSRVPLTTDHRVLTEEIKNLRAGDLAAGTAIGVGLATSVNHLKDSKATSKVIILLTDGVESIDYQNNLLYISPQEAGKIAANKGIKVYTIGVGSSGMAPFPTSRDPFTGELYFSMQPVEIDEDVLKYIANITGGRYFRATDNASLSEIYQEIDLLEKSEINEVKYYNYTELYRKFLSWALILIVLELILRKTVFKELT
ncbi:MAG: VWA domain-containing protein [Weeksellaceae bacterium]